ncbi:MAG: GNAT family N-acetyltransferase [Lachnospiraceae bacterium]|nr:GNAT family N-acetyltransferase [Lachnospiraceae bacterium]
MDKGELKLLWKNVFADEDAYIERFFSQVYNHRQTLTYQENGHIVSMLHMIPYTLQIEGKCFPAMYLYALATEERFRGRKIMSGLICKAHRIAEERGYLCSFLIPEGESLFGFYQRFGYTVPFYDSGIVIQPHKLCHEIGISETDVSNDGLWEMMQSFYKGQNKVIMLHREQFDFFLTDFYESGGRIYKITESKTVLGYAYGICKNGEIVISHTNMDTKVLTGKKINAVITYHIRGVFRPTQLCYDLGIDLNGIYVKNVLC